MTNTRSCSNNPDYDCNAGFGRKLLEPYLHFSDDNTYPTCVSCELTNCAYCNKDYKICTNCTTGFSYVNYSLAQGSDYHATNYLCVGTGTQIKGLTEYTVYNTFLPCKQHCYKCAAYLRNQCLECEPLYYYVQANTSCVHQN